MSDTDTYKVKFDYVQPPNIQSEVPGEQKLREDLNDQEGTNEYGGELSNEKKEDLSSYVPVLTVKKEEAAFTKGDLKLQKVSVTENFSNNNTMTEYIVSYVPYSAIHGEVIEGPQQMRKLKDYENIENQEGIRPRSKIPRLRYEAEKLIDRRRQSTGENEQEVPHSQQRRSSIPRLKRTKAFASNNENNYQQTVDNHQAPNNNSNTPKKTNHSKKTRDESQKDSKREEKTISNEENIPPEIEFDKIYDEIIHSEEEEAVDSKILDKVKVEDTETLEHTFEEIIHDYEENKVQPIDVKEIKSRLPLVKQKSLPEVVMVKKVPRRYSLKNIALDDDTKDGGAEVEDKKKQKPKHGSKLPRFESKDGKVETTKVELTKNNSVIDNNVPITEVKASGTPNTSQNTDPINQINYANQESDFPESYGMDKSDSIRVIETIKIATPIFDKTVSSQTVENTRKSRKDVENVSHENDSIVNSNRYGEVSQEKSVSVKQTEETNATATNKRIKDKALLRGKVSELLNKIKAYDQDTPPVKREISKDIPKSTKVSSKIAVFTKNSNVSKNDNTKTVPSQGISKPNESLRNVNKANAPNNNKEKRNIASKLRRDSNEKVKFVRSESVPIGTKHVISKLRQITPPNTPYNERQDPNDIDNETEPYINVTETEADRFDIENETKKESDVKDLKRSITIHVYHKNKEKEVINFANNTYQKPTKVIETNITESKQETRRIEPKADAKVRNTPNENSNEIKINKKEVPHTQLKTGNNENIYLDVTQGTIELATPDILLKNNPFDAVSTELRKEETREMSEEDNVFLKGKVHRIINKLDSVDESKDMTKKDIIEIPITKSVSSKIAMFERQSQEAAPKFFRRPKKDSTLTQTSEPLRPRIIGQVLKTQPVQDKLVNNKAESDVLVTNINFGTDIRSDDNKDVNKEDIIEATNVKMMNDLQEDEDDNPKERYTAVKYDISNTVITNSETGDVDKRLDNNVDPIALTSDQTQNIEPVLVDTEIATNGSTTEKTNFNGFSAVDAEETVKNSKEIVINQDLKPEEIKDRSFTSKTRNLPKPDDRFKELKSNSEDSNLKKAKSMAELNSVKEQGKVQKVHQLIDRMNSADNLLEKNNNISSRERPRKKSVSEKIALFEHQLLDSKPSTAPSNIKPDTSSAPAGQMSEDELRSRVEELAGAGHGRVEVETMTLADGNEMPVITLGTALQDPALIPHVVSAAIDMGFRSFDVAYIYGNEKEIGESIRAKIDDGTVERGDLYIVNKLWSTFHKRELVEQACRASLERMGLEYFDLYLIHNPMSFKEGPDPFPKIANVLQYSQHDYLDAWFGMEDIVRKGLVRSIGLSNFNSEQVARVVEKGRVKPVVNQVECHPYLNQLRLDLFCADRNIKLMCFGVLGSKGTPQEYKNSTAAVIDDPLVKVMAAGLNVTAAQLLIRYQIECGRAVVVKASRGSHMWDILQALKLRLSHVELDALHALNRNKRTFVFAGMGDTHKNYPFKIPF